jgi:excisionase family DNA binding protein
VNPKIEAAAVRVGEAARLMGMSEPAVRQMIYRGLLPITRIGSRVFVQMDEVNRILRSKIVS